MRTISWIPMVAAIACAASSDPFTEERAAAPTFSPAEGTYASAQTVTLTSVTPDAVIRCTQDGSTPSDASPACDEPFVVSSTTTVLAIATAAGHTPSTVASATYTITPGAPTSATPTFSPAAGTYASAQTVTITSATPDAVIRCTQDGSTPTTASPTCAAPFVVSSTRTVRAIATAAGHTPSAVASATYMIGGAATTADKLRAFSTKRTWFVHMSVGGHIYYGGEVADRNSGLALIADQNPESGSTVGPMTYYRTEAELVAIPAGKWADSLPNAGNGDPVGKLNFFHDALTATFGGGLDYAGIKFCYTDVNSQERVDAAWARYQVVMDDLEARFPGRLIYWTVPLTSYEYQNTFREQLSNSIRARYGHTGRVFDVADYESRDANGVLVLSPGGYRTLNPAWFTTYDETHINAAAANVIAQAYLDFMYGVELRAAAAAR